MPKSTITTSAPIPGWDCTPFFSSSEQLFTCSPSDDYIRHRAYFRFVTQSPPGSDPFGNWITAEFDFIAARGNDLPPLD